MTDINLLLAQAQVSLTKITLAGFLVMLFALLAVLFWAPASKATAEVVALLSSATGVLGTILTQQNGYFFARHRPPGGVDPDSTTINPTPPPSAAKS